MSVGPFPWTDSILKQRYTQRHNKLRKALRAARRTAGLTQIQLCELLDRDKNFVSAVELGVRMLDVLEFIDYAKALGVDARKLLGKVI